MLWRSEDPKLRKISGLRPWKKYARVCCNWSTREHADETTIAPTTHVANMDTAECSVLRTQYLEKFQAYSMLQSCGGEHWGHRVALIKKLPWCHFLKGNMGNTVGGINFGKSFSGGEHGDKQSGYDSNTTLLLSLRVEEFFEGVSEEGNTGNTEWLWLKNFPGVFFWRGTRGTRGTQWLKLIFWESFSGGESGNTEWLW